MSEIDWVRMFERTCGPSPNANGIYPVGDFRHVLVSRDGVRMLPLLPERWLTDAEALRALDAAMKAKKEWA